MVAIGPMRSLSLVLVANLGQVQEETLFTSEPMKGHTQYRQQSI